MTDEKTSEYGFDSRKLDVYRESIQLAAWMGAGLGRGSMNASSLISAAVVLALATVLRSALAKGYNAFALG